MRLAHLRPDELTAEQRQLYDTINQGPRRAAHQGLVSPVGLVDDEGRMQGPFNAMLFHPVIGGALQELGRTLRFSGQLPPRSREIAILIVAESERSDFEWVAHAAIGANLGLSDAAIAALARADTVEFDDPIEQMVAETTRALVATGDLDDQTYRGAEAVLGAAGLVELTTLIGFYRTLALQMRVFRVPAPPGPWVP
ncbi:MAG: carboxymuconolactone decarboxylase family protein [Acidimicrobiales bacterium]